MVERDWCRNMVNAQVDRVKRMFKWAVAEELVPGDVYHALRAVESLRRGTPGVRDTEPVKPVPVETVDAILPYLQPAMRAVVRVQVLTGMRPGELCQLRVADLRTTSGWSSITASSADTPKPPGSRWPAARTSTCGGSR